MAHNRLTPFIKRMRTNGGTIYTFSSAVEDIGLNINERNNVVKVTHFALLDIPEINYQPDLSTNKFNLYAIPGAFEHEQDSASIKDGRVLIAESFQNYALNLESNLLNREEYNSNLQKTVSERVFWKWLKETGAIRWTKDASANWVEETLVDTSTYKPVVKYTGLVDSGNIRTDQFGTYNETYLLVPTSHGQTKAYFYQYEDDNYHHGLIIGDKGENILGREDYTQPHPDVLDYQAYYDFVDSSSAVGSYNTYYRTYNIDPYTPGWWYTYYNFDFNFSNNAYIIDSSLYLTDGSTGEPFTINYNTDLKYDNGSGDVIEFRRSNAACMSLQFDLDELKDIYGDDTLTFQKIGSQYSINDDFEFNTALVYYSVFDSTGNTLLATNLMGVYFLDAPNGNSQDIGANGIQIPSLEKIQSAATGFGTSYQLKLNIKTSNLIDDTQATIVDYSTSNQVYPDDFAEVFNNLNESVKILQQQQSTISYISDQYIDLAEKIDLINNNIGTIQAEVEETQTQNVSNLIQGANVTDSQAIGTFHEKTVSNGVTTLYFKSIKGGPGINVTEPTDGIIQIDASGSFEGIYDPELDDSIEMPYDVGALDAGTTVGDLRGYSYTKLWNKLLFPVIEPDYIAPSVDLTTGANSLYKVEATPTITFTSSFDRGEINIDGAFQDYRSGDPSYYDYASDTGDLTGQVATSSLTDSSTITYNVPQGKHDFQVRVYHKEGPQPKDSYGNDYGSPLSPGYTGYDTLTIEGVYPLFATTSDITIPLDEQPLVSMIDSTYVYMTLASEGDGSNKQKIDIPNKWPVSDLITIETWNLVINQYEVGQGLSVWSTSSTTHNIQGVTENYTRYTHTGDDRGIIDIRLKFNT